MDYTGKGTNDPPATAKTAIALATEIAARVDEVHARTEDWLNENFRRQISQKPRSDRSRLSSRGKVLRRSRRRDRPLRPLSSTGATQMGAQGMTGMQEFSIDDRVRTKTGKVGIVVAVPKRGPFIVVWFQCTNSRYYVPKHRLRPSQMKLPLALIAAEPQLTRLTDVARLVELTLA
jgi:hypothetical protein